MEKILSLFALVILPLFLLLSLSVIAFNVSWASSLLFLRTEQNTSALSQKNIPSLFTLSPELKNIRSQMVKDGAIRNTEFVDIKNIPETENFLLTMVDWQRQQGKLTSDQAHALQSKIKEQYLLFPFK